MAIGCLPVCGDIESIREWITNGENGILVDPTDPYALAEAVQRGIVDAISAAPPRNATWRSSAPAPRFLPLGSRWSSFTAA